MTLTKKVVMYSQNMSPSRIKKAIVNMLEVEDGIPKVREAVGIVKNPVAEDQTYNCRKMMGKLRHMTNTLINNPSRAADRCPRKLATRSLSRAVSRSPRRPVAKSPSRCVTRYP